MCHAQAVPAITDLRSRLSEIEWAAYHVRRVAGALRAIRDLTLVDGASLPETATFNHLKPDDFHDLLDVLSSSLEDRVARIEELSTGPFEENKNE